MSQTSNRIEQDPRWQAIVERNPAFDGQFYYAVTSTGVYCRPSCPARRPKPENVRFHASRAEAEQAGYRPCRRCKPDQPSLAERHATAVAAACRSIETAEEPLSLAALAEAAGLSPHHFHRLFKAITGITPRAYAAAHRRQRVRECLDRGGGSVTAAIYDAGFNSSGRFYALSNQMLGMTPTDYRAGGADTDIRFAVTACALGALLVARSDKGICAISLGDDPESLERGLLEHFPRARRIYGDAAFESQLTQVVALIEHPERGLALPLDIRGTAFQQRVWQALRAIPAGSTASYTEIAGRIGEPKAARAVARACAAHVLAVAIPCHRVLHADGSLSGYRWGATRKRALLQREGSQ